MKKRRLVISLFLIAAVALLSVGYSVLSKTLVVSGKLGASENNANLAIKFVEVGNIETYGSLKYVANPTDENKSDIEKPTFSETIASFSVSNFKYEGDKAVLYLKIRNDSAMNEDLTATLSAPKVSVKLEGANTDKVEDAGTAGYGKDNIFTGDHFTITASYVDTDGVEARGETIGEISTDGLSATLAPKSSADGTGQYLWLKIEINLDYAVVLEAGVSKFPIHDITVSFVATATPNSGQEE
jgi:hypothetical protein